MDVTQAARIRETDQAWLAQRMWGLLGPSLGTRNSTGRIVHSVTQELSAHWRRADKPGLREFIRMDLGMGQAWKLDVTQVIGGGGETELR